MKLKRTLAVLLSLMVFISVTAGCKKSNGGNLNIDSVRVSDTDLSEIEIKVNDALKESEFCGSAAITLNEQEIYKNSFGYADPVKKKKLNNSTRYSISLLAKNITGAAVLMLEKRGKLKLDDTLDKYFGTKGKTYLTDITVEQLLDGSVSFGSFQNEIYGDGEYIKYKSFFESKNSDKYCDKIRKMVLEHIFAHGAEEIKGSTNSNYYLLGEIVAKASGTSYKNFVQKNIYDKLGMKNSGFVSTKCRFAGYDMNNNVWKRFSEYRSILNFGFTYSVNGLYSSADDLSLFYRAIVNGTLDDIDYIKKIKLASSNIYCGFERDGNNITAAGRIVAHCSYVHINMETNEAVTLLSNRVGKKDISNTGDELYTIISSKINGIIIRSIKKS